MSFLRVETIVHDGLKVITHVTSTGVPATETVGVVSTIRLTIVITLLHGGGGAIPGVYEELRGSILG